MPSSYNLANDIVNNYLKTSVCYVALFLNETQRDGSGTEINAPSYARKTIVFGTPSNGIVTNKLDVVFDQAQEDWGITTFYGIYDAPTGGNLFFYDRLLFGETIKAGETLRIPAEQLQLSVI